MSKVYVFTQYGGPEHEELQERPVPQPGAGELLVEVRAAGVNPADWKIRTGQLGTNGQLPAAMGLEVAGVVTAVGDGRSEERRVGKEGSWRRRPSQETQRVEMEEG